LYSARLNGFLILTLTIGFSDCSTALITKIRTSSFASLPSRDRNTISIVGSSNSLSLACCYYTKLSVTANTLRPANGPAPHLRRIRGVPNRRIACNPDRDLKTRASVTLIRLPHRPRIRSNSHGRKILRQIAGSLAFPNSIWRHALAFSAFEPTQTVHANA